jgi:hypothetical protein
MQYRAFQASICCVRARTILQLQTVCEFSYHLYLKYTLSYTRCCYYVHANLCQQRPSAEITVECFWLENARPKRETGEFYYKVVRPGGVVLCKEAAWDAPKTRYTSMLTLTVRIQIHVLTLMHIYCKSTVCSAVIRL